MRRENGVRRRNGARVSVLWVSALAALLLGVAAPAAGAAEGVPSRAAYLAAHLRENPVYVTDQIPREIPRSTAPQFARTAHRTGVRTYVIVLPSSFSGDTGMLAAVHDRLGEDGLYVLLDETGVEAAQGFGIRLPVDDALTASIYAVPYDAGPAAGFDYFVDVLTSHDAARLAEQARREHADDHTETRWTSQTDRENQAVLTGFLMAGVGLSILLVGRYLLARRRGRVVEAASGTSKRARADALQRALDGQRRARWLVRGAALVSVVAIGVAAQLTFGDARSEPGAEPTHADMTARADRVAHGLAQDPLYIDPESPAVLTAADADALRTRVRKTKLPVRVVVMPESYEGPSAGNTTVFAQKLYERTGVSAVYVLVDPTNGHVEIKDEGSPLNAERFGVPASVAEGADTLSAGDDLPDRLDTLLTDLSEAPTGGRGGFPEIYSPPEDPRHSDALPSLFSGDFWGGALLLGPIVALLAWLVVGTFTRIAFGPMRGRKATTTARAGSSRHGQREDDGAPTRPSARWLRRTARTELDGLTTEFARHEGELKDEARTRVWECLDAATLFADLDGDQRLDADADAERLTCVVVLLRLGAAALHTGSAHAADRYCGVNPLHGPAHHTRKLALPGDAGPRPLPVCGSCRNLSAKVQAKDAVARSVLRLPVPGKGSVLRYDRGDGPLSGAGGDTCRLVNDVRETLGVH
jgi:hypothetical protein